MHVDPTPEQYQSFKDLPANQPFAMLNLIRLRVEAAYHDGRAATGPDAYAAYTRATMPVFQRLGGEIVWRGRPEAVLVGPAEGHWDIAFIARYPTGHAFLDMITDPVYQAAIFHRRAAIEDCRMIRIAETSDTEHHF